MSGSEKIREEVPGLYRILPLKLLRRTPGATFDIVPRDLYPGSMRSIVSSIAAAQFPRTP